MFVSIIITAQISQDKLLFRYLWLTEHSGTACRLGTHFDKISCSVLSRT